MRQSLKSLGRRTGRNGTLIIESSLRLVRLLINKYGNNRTRHTPCDSIQGLEWLWIQSVTHRNGLPAFPRQLDWQGFGYDQNVWEGTKKRCESFIYLLIVVERLKINAILCKFISFLFGYASTRPWPIRTW